jgi:hypothetical protein
MSKNPPAFTDVLSQILDRSIEGKKDHVLKDISMIAGHLYVKFGTNRRYMCGGYKMSR